MSSFYLFCHYDVALAPDALRHMVEESYHQMSVVGPKVVNWERPNELLDLWERYEQIGSNSSEGSRGARSRTI